MNFIYLFEIGVAEQMNPTPAVYEFALYSECMDI